LRGGVGESGDNSKTAKTAGSSLSGTLIVTATGSEFRAVAALISQRVVETSGQLRLSKGFIGSRPVSLVKTGIGAEGLIQPLEAHLARTGYDALLIAGLAGGLNPGLKAGDVVIYDSCLSIAGPKDEVISIDCDSTLVSSIEAGLRACGFAPHLERGVTVGSMITESRAKTEMGARLGAAAVDMESFMVLASARHAGVPAAVLRVVLDEAGLDTPDFNAALTAGGRLASWRLARELMRRPHLTLRFIARLPKAHRMLRKALQALLFTPNAVKYFMELKG
jgi:adenosylhomocysteine nucleosidase